MEEADYKKYLELLEKLAHKCHLAALKGTADFEFARSVTTHFEIRAEEKELVNAEDDLKKLEAEIEEHLVQKAEGEEYNVLKNISKAIKNLYLSIFNMLIFERAEIRDLEAFVDGAMAQFKEGAEEFKKEIAKVALGLAREWHDDLKKIMSGVHAVEATAKDRKTIALGLTKALHTHGASFMKRRQEQNLIKHARKEGDKAHEEGIRILQRKFHSKEEAEKILEAMEEDEKKSIEEYEKAFKLLATDWEFAFEEFDKLSGLVDTAAKEHELPTRDPAQMDEIHKLLIAKLVAPFGHSLQEGVNQLDSMVRELESHLN